MGNSYTSWMIGDTCLDIISANNANINSIGVTSGYSSLEKLQNCANIIKENTFEAVNEIVLHTIKNK